MDIIIMLNTCQLKITFEIYLKTLMLVFVQDPHYLSDIEAEGREASVFDHTYFLLCSIPVYIDISFHSKLRKCSLDMH